MATQVRHPIWLPALRQPGARTFALLYGLESFARATVTSVVPIQAYDILQREQSVSILYTLVSLVGLGSTLSVPLLLGRYARRWVYTSGVLALIAGSAFFVTDTLTGQVLGMLARIYGASALSITLNLYIMDHIRKMHFAKVESVRLAWSTIAWTAGPTLGVWLYAEYGLAAAHGSVVAFSLALLALFWYFRLSDNPLIAPGKLRPSSPWKNIGRFVAQPRLRMAWLIAFGRSCFWTTFFVYAPLLMVVSGQGTLAGGILVSAANALLFTALIWERAGRRFGVRRVLTFCFFAMAATLFLAALAGERMPWMAGAALLACTFFCIAHDALGSSVYMRAVHAYERPQMTSVYRTYLDLSELTPQIVYTGVFAFAGIGGVFAALGIFSAICGWFTWRYVSRHM